LFGEQTHAGMITVLIDNILQQTQTSKSQLTAIAISDGPGSYTGLRIGSSTAKGLCFALDIPLLAVSTLEAMALQVADAFVGHAKDENKNDKISLLNSVHKRNEGSTMCYGIKKWNFAKSIIPGGNSLLSKRPILYCPDLWPTYFSKAKNIYVWDLQNNKYLDMSLMGVGTNILGYANDAVNKKVIQSIKKSNMSTLNCIEEVELAQQLIKLHPWS
jgi:hypothetical protein